MNDVSKTMGWKQVVSVLMLLVTSMIWGAAFVAQSVSMDYIEPFTFICLRSLLGGIVLLPVIAVVDRISGRKREKTKEEKKGWKDPRLWQAGIICGILLFLANCAQQTGIQYTTAGKAGFITAMYIVLVPIAAFVIFRKKCSLLTVLGVCLGIAGLYFLCISGQLEISKGDYLIIICSFMFTGQILAIDYYGEDVDGMKMACIEFCTGGVLSFFCMLLFETPRLDAIYAAAVPIIYTGVLSTAVAYTLQILAQQNLNPTIAALLMSLEAVFSVLAGYLILHELLTPRETLGCILMFAAVILAQIPVGHKPDTDMKTIDEPV